MEESLLERIAKSAKMRVAGAVLSGFLGYQAATSYIPGLKSEAYAMEAEGSVKKEATLEDVKAGRVGEYNPDGWEVPDLSEAQMYSDKMYDVPNSTQGEMMRVEKFYTTSGGRIFRISHNGNVFAYSFDSDRRRPIEFEIANLDGDDSFESKLYVGQDYDLPDWTR